VIAYSFEQRRPQRNDLVISLLLGASAFILLTVVKIIIAHAPTSAFGTAVGGILSPGFWIAYGAMSKVSGTDYIAQPGIGVGVLFVVSAAVDIGLYGAVIFSIRRLVAHGARGKARCSEICYLECLRLPRLALWQCFIRVNPWLLCLGLFPIRVLRASMVNAVAPATDCLPANPMVCSEAREASAGVFSN
jgi:hypothetical protein